MNCILGKGTTDASVTFLYIDRFILYNLMMCFILHISWYATLFLNQLMA